jgi:hypothetical protein
VVSLQRIWWGIWGLWWLLMNMATLACLVLLQGWLIPHSAQSCDSQSDCLFFLISGCVCLMVTGFQDFCGLRTLLLHCSSQCWFPKRRLWVCCIKDGVPLFVT